MNKYVFRKYTNKYKKLFQSEKRNLKSLFGFSRGIEHIGSTAIPSLGGKGVIDVLIGVPKDKIVEIKRKLEKSNYEFREVASVKGRLFFRRDYKYRKKVRRVHIHVVEFGKKDYNEKISFRDYLLENPKLVEKYSNLKKDAIKKAKGSGRIYRKYKDVFIKKVTQKALKNFGK